MQREEAHPSGRVDRILMRVVPRLGDVVGNVVNGNDPVGERQEDEQMIPNAKKLRRSITVSG
jgi:hypothetical protein